MCDTESVSTVPDQTHSNTIRMNRQRKNMT